MGSLINRTVVQAIDLGQNAFPRYSSLELQATKQAAGNEAGGDPNEGLNHDSSDAG
jgi:hypothetical protein